MNHIDEHILELYALHSSDIEDRRGEIEQHLLECQTCRELTEEIAAQYANAVQDLSEIEKQPVGTSASLVPSHDKLIPFQEVFESQLMERQSALSRFVRFVKNRPAATAIGGIGLVAACVLGGVTLATRMAVRDNPQSVFMDEKSHRFEVFNANNRLLWDLPYLSVMTGGIYESTGPRMQATVADLDGDGRNEVVVSAMLPEDSGDQVEKLRVFNYDKSLVFMQQFPVRLRYGPYPYDEMYHAGFVLLPEGIEHNKRDVVVYSVGRRSPISLVRLDGSGNVLGKYWHYGMLHTGFLTEIAGANHQMAILLGSNDAVDTLGLNRDHDVTIIVLNTQKIEGTTESSATRGFGFERSTAEMFYIKLPTNDMMVALGARQSVRLISHSDSMLVFATISMISDIHGSNTGAVQPTFDFGFNRKMEPLWVKSTDTNNELHKNLRKKGLIKSVLNQQYLDNLKHQIQFWDGSQWRNQWCQVQPPQ